ncbi:hypothetical protein BG011_002865 [Mortierella polycephala]|uniref:Uncharacterized protein n=1 Tax=Mortierella polycephala TaxID=41804 RepID=A0A9P6Q3E2_9FUNG|nr:hypothetical protein BG011_002865 [Mortierella polycephala]
MYEDPIPQFSCQYIPHQHHHLTNNNNDRDNNDSIITSNHEDQELQRLHQHQLLIQLRLEVNSLRTQIQQLELLKQQLVLQRTMMHPSEYEQLMGQFSRTLASLLSVRQPNHFSGDGRTGVNSGNSIDDTSRGVENIGGGGNKCGNNPSGGYSGMPMMEKLQERLRSLTIQQSYQQQQQHCQQPQQQHGQHPQQNGVRGDVEMGQGSTIKNGGMMMRRDPVRMEQTNLEAELRDLEKRMRSIQLLC